MSAHQWNWIGWLLGGLLSANVALAAERPPFEIVKVTAEIYTELPRPMAAGKSLPYTFGEKQQIPDGQVAVGVFVTVNAKFDKTKNRLHFEDNAFSLIAGQTPCTSAGWWEYYAALYDTKYGVGVMAFDNVIRKPRPVTVNKVFFVPAKEKQLMVKLGDQTAAVILPSKPTQLDVKKAASFKVLKAELVPSIAQAQGADFTNPNGKVLLVTCEWSVLPGHDIQHNGYESFAYGWLNIKSGKPPVLSPCAGSVSTVTKELSGPSSEGGSGVRVEGTVLDDPTAKPFVHTDIFAFAVPADTNAFELQVLGQTLSRGTVTRKSK